MRVNTPVTGNEYPLPEGATLMSTTDEKGRIRYANAAFVRVSGFSEEELQGQPHNIVRHPDMPPDAFEDMWRTLKGGEPWTALVKNRRKNGDHYWVRANATPVVRNGQLQGFMSVRTEVTTAEIAAAQDLYAQWNEGRQGNRVFFKGMVIRSGFWRCLSFHQTASVRARLWAGILGLLPLQMVAAWWFLGATPAFLGLASAVGISSAIALGYLEAQIVRPLRRLRSQALRIASGDSQAVNHMNRMDDIGMTLRVVGQLGLMFRWLINDISGQILNVQAATQDIAQGNNDLSSRTEKAAVSVQRTTASMEQVTESLRQTAAAAHTADRLALDASNAASQGGEAVAGFVHTMNDIADSSRRIQDIVGVIDNFAFQTNILALNAAVEAARAGEQGKGFSVVAGEVRSLAQRSSEAAKEIKGLIQASVVKVSSGTRQVNEAGDSMSALVNQVNRVSSLIGEISKGAQEQSVELGRVGEDVSRLDDITQQNAALVEQGTAASESLSVQTRRLAEAVLVFR